MAIHNTNVGCTSYNKACQLFYIACKCTLRAITGNCLIFLSSFQEKWLFAYSATISCTHPGPQQSPHSIYQSWAAGLGHVSTPPPCRPPWPILPTKTPAEIFSVDRGDNGQQRDLAVDNSPAQPLLIPYDPHPVTHFPQGLRTIKAILDATTLMPSPPLLRQTDRQDPWLPAWWQGRHLFSSCFWP